MEQDFGELYYLQIEKQFWMWAHPLSSSERLEVPTAPCSVKVEGEYSQLTFRDLTLEAAP